MMFPDISICGKMNAPFEMGAPNNIVITIIKAELPSHLDNNIYFEMNCNNRLWWRVNQFYSISAMIKLLYLQYCLLIALDTSA